MQLRIPTPTKYLVIGMHDTNAIPHTIEPLPGFNLWYDNLSKLDLVFRAASPRLAFMNS
jgi:hypothetical protein